MKPFRYLYNSVIITFVFCLSSCDKGYEIRFTNFYIEPMDSVVVGGNKVVFKDIALESATGYEKITGGDYRVIFISKTKKRFYSPVSIPKSGGGKKSIQIDGVSSVAILDD